MHELNIHKIRPEKSDQAIGPELQAYIGKRKIITFASHFRFSLFSLQDFFRKSGKVIFSLFSLSPSLLKSEKISFPLSLSLLKNKSLFHFSRKSLNPLFHLHAHVHDHFECQYLFK